VLFTGSNIREFFSATRTFRRPRPIPSGSHSLQTFRAASPEASHITIQPQAYWGELNEAQLALYGDADSHAVVTWLFGDGELVWWAGSTPLTNAGITRDDNLAFFLNSVSNWSAHQRYQIYWDEYFHGQRSSLWSYARRPSFIWGLVQIGLLAAAVIFTFSRRSGPVYRPQVASRGCPRWNM
jgi:hypothetical protein